MLLAPAVLHDGDGVGRGVELAVGKVFEETTLRAEPWIVRVDGRLWIAVLQVLADDGGIIERELAVHEGRHLGPWVHVHEVTPVAVAVERPHALEGQSLLVQRDPYLPRVGAEHIVVEREHVRRPSTRGRTNPVGPASDLEVRRQSAGGAAPG